MLAMRIFCNYTMGINLIINRRRIIMEKKIIIRIQADTKIGQIWISTNGGEPEYAFLKIRQDKDGTKVWNARNGIYAKLPQKRYRFNWTKHIAALQADLIAMGAI